MRNCKNCKERLWPILDKPGTYWCDARQEEITRRETNMPCGYFKKEE